MVDGRNLKLITSSTGWLDIYTNLISNGGLQKYGYNILRNAFAAYYLERKKDLIFSHEDNFKKLTNYEKTLVFFVVTKEGYLTVNWGFHKNFYVGDDLHNKFNTTFFKLCARPDGVMTRQILDIYSKNTSLNIPYKKLYIYRVINTFPNDAVWFDTNTVVIDVDWKVFMQIKITNEKYKLLSDQNDPLLLTTLQQPTSSFNFNITNDKFNTIKKYNDYSDKFKNLNIETVKASREHSNFLYDNNALIRETFITEINKKVNLIGSITFYEKADKTGKSFLITSGTKLKFDLKENRLTDNFNFNISRTNESGKILLKKNELHNLLLVAIEKLTRNGQKRKMVEIVDTIIVKALQSYDKYSTLNPLEINLNSNYLTKIIHDYKGFVFEIRLINVLFSANIQNETQNIFLTCQNLTSAKKALINNKIYYLLGIINLNEIKQWNEMKGKSLYVNAKIDDSHYMKTAKHFGFSFKTSFPTEFLEFTCDFLDDKAEKIKFAGGEEKVPIIDLRIDILK